MTFRPLSPFRPFAPFKYGTRTLASQVRALFANGEQGAIYGTDFSTLFQDAGPTNPVTAVEQQVGYRLDMSGRGNHLVQATATKRAYVSRRVNLLTKTEDFADGYWLKTGVSVVGQKIVESADNDVHWVGKTNVFSANGASRIWGLDVNAGERRYLTFGHVNVPGTVSNIYTFDALTGTWGAVGDGITATGFTSVALDDVWWRIGFTSSLASNSYDNFWSSLSDAASMPAGYAYQGDGTSGLYIRKPSVTLTIDSHLPYQWVNTATDYDADPSKFPTLNRYDGIDDSASSSTGGGGTAGFFFSSAITVAGGAGTNRVLFSDAGTNTGYIVRINASNQLELAAGDGTAYTTVASVATIDLGTSNVVQAWDDGTNLNVRINDGAVASVARPTVSAGTASYTIGQDNGASTGYFNGREYSTIYRKDSGLTADQRDQVRRYQLQQARFV